LLAGVGVHDGTFAGGTLDRFMDTGPATWRAVRDRVTALLSHDPTLRDDRALRDTVLRPLDGLAAVLAFSVADYVDYYSLINHATNMGRILRPDTDPLPPHWRHLPIGYHGRAGTVVVSGTPVRRPRGLVGDATG